MTDEVLSSLTFRLADEWDIPSLVAMRDAAAVWMASRGICQWRPGALGETHFRDRMKQGEVWVATNGPAGPVVGAWELWWEDVLTWGPQPSAAGYIHRLMIDRCRAPRGAGRVLLAAAEHRIAAAGRSLARLDCATDNLRLRRYYTEAAYREVGVQLLCRGSPYPVTLLEKHLLQV